MTIQLNQKNFALSVKSVNDDGTFEAYGSIFGNVDSYGDIVMKGAFTKTLADRGNKVRLLWQHDQTKPIGKFVSMSEDDIGLLCQGKLNLDTIHGKEAYAMLKHGDIDGMSIGFQTIKDSTDKMAPGIRMLTELKLYEVSLVTFPANEEATVTSVKSAFDDLTQEEKLSVLNFINKSLKTPLTSDIEPPTVETVTGNTQEIKEAGMKQVKEPPVDADLLHSLKQLSLVLKTQIK